MGETATLQFAARQESITCYKCGVIFTMPSHMLATRRNDKAAFWCPNGHSQAFEKSTEDQLREQLDATKRTLEMARAETDRQRREREAAERRASAARGQVTKIKNRVGNGVCPCCNRTFQNLMRHMTTKHPEFRHEGVQSESTDQEKK